MEHLRYVERPELRSPILVAAFEGWSDASEVASWTARFLVRQWAAPKFAEVEPEEFYVFTERRPQVRWQGEARRTIFWPANEFHYYRSLQSERDLIILSGVEPHLKWKTFVDAIVQVIQEMQVSVVLTLGGVLAAVPHTQAARLSGTATDPDLLQRLHSIPVNASRYEGPTGILSVLNTTLESTGILTASLWGSVPHYLSARPNVKVALAMLRQLDEVLGLDLNLQRVERRAARFDAQVEEAMASNPELLGYVRKLEEELGRSGEDEPAIHEELPSGEAIVRDLEEYLRRRTEEEPGNRG